MPATKHRSFFVASFFEYFYRMKFLFSRSYRRKFELGTPQSGVQISERQRALAAGGNGPRFSKI
ncbi:MAG: hypothetical protein KGI72_00490 [Patescibacteria group bacterium]|nr:hypothetical protein [Patescibacteria group bacterium]